MSKTHPLRILFVEDHLDYQQLLVSALSGAGHLVEAVSTTAAALAATAKAQFDMVLCDYRLRDGSGADLMRELKRRHGLRGICLSGYGEDELSFLETREPIFAKILDKGVAFKVILSAIDNLAATIQQPDTHPGDQQIQ